MSWVGAVTAVPVPQGSSSRVLWISRQGWVGFPEVTTSFKSVATLLRSIVTTSETISAEDDRNGRNRTLVDPRAPRFGQTLTAVGLVAGIALGEPLLVVAVTAILVSAVLSGWRVDAYGLAWRYLVVPVVGKPTERESASPHRFAKLLGAGFTAVASAALIAGVGLGSPGLVLAGYGVAALVAGLAGLAAIFDICVGCRMYGQFAVVRRLGWV